MQIRIVPVSGSGAAVLIGGFAPLDDPSLRSTGDIKKRAKAMGEAALSGAVERGSS